ncbi:MAG: phosphomannomutase [Candidatus Saccharibacteria bacterium]|nr:phosphomannomutase [Candidatus Saccharibacteria bacterium]
MTVRNSLTYEPVELAFGTSGLRGLVTDMTDLECYINAFGFLKYLQKTDSLSAGATIYLGGDLRQSTPRIMAVMVAAITDAGLQVVNCGLLPTPAVAFYAQQKGAPCIMVTGSHIPADRNGIKFYKTAGELLKTDEAGMKQQVAAVRQEAYSQEAGSNFGDNGSLKELPAVPAVNPEPEQVYLDRYKSVFNDRPFASKQIIMYQHSAVGRDLIVKLFTELGADVVPVERSDTFVSIDTENVTDEDKALFKQFATTYPGNFAIISTDGDSDRPFVIDAEGRFHNGDVLGCVVADYLGAKFAALPISANDAADTYCAEKGIELVHTKIGSPYVIAAMNAADPALTPRVSWEVNGGFLLGTPVQVNGQTLEVLPTRDAVLPIICALLAALQSNQTVAELFAALPARYTSAGLVNSTDEAIQPYRAIASDQAAMQSLAESVFAGSLLGTLTGLDITDGLRLSFSSGDVIHLRPSGNAPQFRVYSNAGSQDRADQLVKEATAPGGYIEQLLNRLAA